MGTTKRAVQTVLFLATTAMAATAWAQGGRSAALFPGTCAGGQFSMGSIYFPNVGKNDRGEGAPSVIRISLCSLRPNRSLRLTRGGGCPGRVMSRTRFQNVARSDFNEGAPNFVILQLCRTGPSRRRYQITTGACRAGMRLAGNPLRFKNVGNNDRNQGAANHVTVSLCVG